MADSLVIGNVIEVLGGGVPSNLPLCAGAVFRLSPGWDLSAPQPSADVVASLILGGGLPLGQHVANRAPKLPVTILVPPTGDLNADRATLAGAREMLMQAVNADRWTLVWTREGGLPMLLDCFHAAPAVVTYSLAYDKGLLSEIEITFEALPFGKSDVSEVIAFNSPATTWTPPPASVTIDDFNTITNWLSGNDSTFDATQGNWTARSNCTIARTTAQTHAGAGALALTSTSTSSMTAMTWSAAAYASGLPVVVNDVVTMSAWFRAATAARNVSLGIDWRDASGGLVATAFGTSTAGESTSAWFSLSQTFTAPAGAVYALGFAFVATPGAAGEVHYVDDVNLNRGAIYSSTDLRLFSQSTRVAVGTRSLHWARAANAAPNYTHVLAAPVNITGLRKISVWMGLGTTAPNYAAWHTGKVTVAITLTDAVGATVTMHTTVTAVASGLITAPRWQKVSGWVPQVTSFDYTTVSSYQLQAWSRAGPVLQAEAYFDTLRADAAATGAPGPRGAIYSISGAVGTAPSACGFQLQPGASVVQQTALFTTPGSNNWTAPVGVTSVQKAECWGGGSGGAQGGQWGGAGGGGGEHAAEYNIPVTPSTVYHPIVGAAGLGGDGTHGGHASTAGGDSSFIGDGGFGAYAHGATPAGLVDSFYAGHGGDGSANSLHYPGGNGLTIVPGVLLGSGGGGSGGPYGAGGQAPGTTSNPTPGAPAVDQGGPGGKGGGLTAPHAGFTPATGPGGGGGGGTGIASGTQPAGANGASGQVKLTWAAQLASPLKTAIVHLPRRDAPSSVAPMITTGGGVDTPNGGTVYTAPQTGSLQARYQGTYQVILTVSSWSSPASSRTITVTIQQHKADGTNVTSVLTKTLVPNTDPDILRPLNGLVAMGTVTLPLAAISAGNNTDLIQVTVNDTITADRFLDTLILDVAGQTVIYSASGSGVNNLWITEPEIGADAGIVYGSAADWDTASSVMADVPVISGGPMALMPGENPFFVYSVQAAPALQAAYLPRWYLDRLA